MYVPVRPLMAGGLSYNIRAVSKQRLRRFCGAVSPATMDEVEMRIRILLGL